MIYNYTTTKYLTHCFYVSADGYYEYIMSECFYSTSDYSDMVLLQSYSFNKVVDVQYNSSLGKFVGYTEEGVKYAENWNKNQAYMQQLKAQVDTFCRPNAQIFDSNVRDKAGECYNTPVSSLLHNKYLTMFVHWWRRNTLKKHTSVVLLVLCLHIVVVF